MIEFQSQTQHGKRRLHQAAIGRLVRNTQRQTPVLKLIELGIRLPEAKLPGRSEIEIMANSGNTVTAINTHNAACEAKTRSF